MKKRLIIILFCILTGLQWYVNVSAEEYTSYQEIVFMNDDAYLLKEFSDQDYEDYYQLLPKRKWMGWVIYLVHENEEVEFISETKLRIVNDGYSTIRHNITLKSSEETKLQLSASGAIGISVKGDVKKFKGTLDADIKANISYTKSQTLSEEYEFSIIVDPGTYVRIVTRGKGEISNGVAKYYFFWVMTKKGGFETFVITTEYYEIIKEKIR